MRISPEHIQEKAIAGKTKAGAPILYILTKGGLHAFFVKGDQGIESIGAAPHRAVAEWIAEKKQPGIEWSPDFAKSLGKSEQAMFDRVRTLIFAPVPDEPIPDNGMFFVYDPAANVIEVVEKSELSKFVKNGRPGPFVRPVNLAQPVDFLEYQVIRVGT